MLEKPEQSEAKEFNATAAEIESQFPKVPREFVLSGDSGEIVDRRTQPETKIGVSTDSGAITRKDQEVLTNKVVGCAGLFLEGKESNAFFHLTPGSRLGYRYADSMPKFKDQHCKGTADNIRKSLPEGETAMSGIIIVNIGMENGSKFDYIKILSDAHKMAGYLKEQGLGTIKVVELPLDTTTIYYTPSRPGEIFACGNEAEINERGGLDYKKTVKSFWVDLDSNNTVKYVKHNKPEEIAA